MNMQSLLKHKQSGHTVVVDGQLSDLLYEQGYRMVSTARRIHQGTTPLEVTKLGSEEDYPTDETISHNMRAPQMDILNYNRPSNFMKS